MEIREARRRLFTPTEAAHELSTSRSQVYREIQAGRLRTVRLGTRMRITADDLDDYVHRLRSSAPAADIDAVETTHA